MRIALCLVALGWALLSGASRALSGEAAAAGGKPAVDAHTLFLAHYDAGFDADCARGDGKPIKATNRGGAVRQPGRFGNGVSIPRGAFGVAYRGAGNVNSSQGTIEFWLKGDFPDATTDNPREFYLPLFVCGGTAGTGLAVVRNQYNQLHVAISEAYRATLGIGFSCGGPNRINDGQWHHVAVTWDAEHAAIFLDGRRKAWTEGPRYPAVANWAGDLYVGYGSEDDYWYSQSDRKDEYRPSSAQAVLDELRISDCVRYVADFVPSDREFSLHGRPAATGPGVAGAAEVTEGRTGDGVEQVDGPDGKAAYIHASTVPGDYLYYRVDARANRFLGSLACRLQVPWPTSDQRRHFIVDLRNRSQTGYLLERRADGHLCFSAQQDGRVQTEVSVPAGGICDGKWHELTAVWHTEGLSLLIDGQRRGVSAQATVVPSTLGRELFAGSSYAAVDQLEGAISEVKLGTEFRGPETPEPRNSTPRAAPETGLGGPR